MLPHNANNNQYKSHDLYPLYTTQTYCIDHNNCSHDQAFFRVWLRIYSTYNPKKGYGFVPYVELPEPLTLSAVYAILGLTEVSDYIAKKQCRRYSIDPTFYQAFLNETERLNYLPPLDEGYQIPDRYQEVSGSPIGIRINIDQLSKSYPGRKYIHQWKETGELNENGIYTPRYFRSIENGRMYILRQYNYQCMPNHLKKSASFPDQQNMDIVSCHPTIAGKINPEINHLAAEVRSLGGSKYTVLQILNGGGVKSVTQMLRDGGVSVSIGLENAIRNLKEVVKGLAIGLSTPVIKLWKHYQRVEQVWIKTITDYLDAIEVGYVNMHDGLMVDQRVDYSHLRLEFEWIEKEIPD